MNEKIVHQHVCEYLKLQYRRAIFMSDYGAGIKLTMGQARQQARLKSSKGLPDLFIAEPRGKYHGLFIELKADGIKTHKLNGELVANDHIRQQAQILEQLEQRGYRAVFAIGFDQAKQVIDNYFNRGKYEIL